METTEQKNNQETSSIFSLDDIISNPDFNDLGYDNESALSWYKKIAKQDLTPEQKYYFFNDTKEILKSYDVNSFSDSDIKNLIDNNNLETLDRSIVNIFQDRKKKEYSERYKNLILDSSLPVEERTKRIAETKREEANLYKNYNLASIQNIRARRTSEILSKKEQEKAKQTYETYKPLEERAAKTNYVAQSLMDAKNKYEQSDVFTQFAWSAENFTANLPGFSVIKNAVDQDFLEGIGLTESDRSIGKRAFDAVFSGSTWDKISSNFWSLPYEESKLIVDAIDRTYKDKPVTRLTVLSKLIGLTSTQVAEENLGELLNLYYAKGLLNSAKEVLKKQPKPPFIDVDYTKIEPKIPPQDVATKLKTYTELKGATPQEINLWLAGGGRVRVKVSEAKNVNKYKYVDWSEAESILKKNPKAVFEAVPEWDTTPTGSTVSVADTNATVKSASDADVSSTDTIRRLSYNGEANVKSSSPKAEAIKPKVKGTKVTSPDGEPLVVYHGTSTGTFNKFDNTVQKYGLYGEGVYATDAKDIAWGYTKKGKGKDPAVYSLYMDIKNPLDMESIADPQLARSIFSSLYPNSSFTDIEVIELLDEPGSSFKTIEEVIKAKNLKNKDLFSILENEMMANETLEYDVGEYVRDALQKEGYDGITHIGGVRGGKKHRVYIALDESQVHIINKESPKGVEEVPNKDNEGLTQNEKLTAATMAYSAGETAAGDLNIGARASATDKAVTAINDYQNGSSQEPPSPPTFFVAYPEFMSGAPKNNISNNKILQETDPNLYTRKEIEELGGYYSNIKDLDPEAYYKMEKDAEKNLKTDFYEVDEWLKRQPIDLKLNMDESSFDIEPQSKGLEVTEFYGVGVDGNSPLTLSFEEVQKATQGGPFEPIQMADGSIWLTKKYWMPYDTSTATKLDLKDAWSNFFARNLLSINKAGVDIVTAARIYQSVAYTSYWRELLEKKYKDLLKGVSRKTLELAERILYEERLRGKAYGEKSLATKANFDPEVISFVEGFREIPKITASVLNDMLLNMEKSKGNKSLRLTNNLFKNKGIHIQDFEKDFKGKKLDKPKRTEIEANFVADARTGEIYKPNTKLPIESFDDVDIYKLDPIIYYGNDPIEHLITKKGQDVEISELPFRQLGDYIYGGWANSDPYFIKYDRIFVDSAGRPRATVKTLASVSSLKEGKLALKKFNTALDTIRKVVNGVLTEAEGNRLLQKALLEVKPFVPELQTIEGFKDFLREMKAEDLLNEYHKLRVEADSYTSTTAVTLTNGDTIAGNNYPTRYQKSENFIMNPFYSIFEPKLLQMADYASYEIKRGAALLGIQNLYLTTATRFDKTFRHLINPNIKVESPMDFLRDPMAYIDKKYAKTKEAAKALAFSKMFNLGTSQNLSSLSWDAVGQWTADKMIESMNIPGITTLESLMRNFGKLSPAHKSTTLIYLATFAVTPAQFIKQLVVPFSVASSMSVGGKEAWDGVALFIPTRIMMYAQMHGYDDSAIAKAIFELPKMLSLFGGGSLTVEDLKVISTKARQMGLGKLAFNNIRGNGVLASARGKIFDLFMAPFEKGNTYARMHGFLTATRMRQKETGKHPVDFDETDWAEVIRQGDIIGGASSTARRTVLESLPVVHSLAMFTSYINSLFEMTVLNSLNLPKSRWMYMLLSLSAMWGLSFWFDDDTSDEIIKTMEDKYQIDFSQLKYAFFGALAQQFLPYKVSLRDWEPHTLQRNFLWQLTDLFASSTIKDKEDIDFNRKFYLASLWDKVGKAVGGIRNIWLDPYGYKELPIIPGWEDLSTEEKLTKSAALIASVSPIFTSAQRFYLTQATKQYITTEGLDKIPANANRENVPLMGLVEYTTGIQPAIYDTPYEIREYSKSKSSENKELISAAINAEVNFLQTRNRLIGLSGDSLTDEDLKENPEYKNALNMAQLAKQVAIQQGDTQRERSDILNQIQTGVSKKFKIFQKEVGSFEESQRKSDSYAIKKSKEEYVKELSPREKETPLHNQLEFLENK